MLRSISLSLISILSAGVCSGQSLVKDINPLTVNGNGLAATSAPVLAVGSIAYFAGNDGTSGTELWKTDGTAAGTVMVKDINAGAGLSSSPANFVAFGTGVLFSATEAASGIELWKSDGTVTGTVLVSDIYPGTSSSSPSGFTVIGTNVYFAAADGTATTGVGRELWKYDGATVSLVKDIFTGATTNNGITGTGNMVAVGTTLYFAAQGSATNVELWKSDGTAVGTVLVLDINTTTATASSSPVGLVAWGAKVIFQATDGLAGTEPWISDGTAGGTIQLKDVMPGTTGSTPTLFVVAGSKCFFTATDSTPVTGTGREMYVTDGTPAGTNLIVDFNPGLANGSEAFGNTAIGSRCAFQGTNPTYGTEGYITDGTAAGTVLFCDAWSGPNSGYPAPYFPFAGKFLTNGSTSLATGNWELIITDGTIAGTGLVKEIGPGAFGSDPNGFFILGTKCYFFANDTVTGIELWVTDGTAAGTVLVKDINSVGLTAASSSPGPMVKYNGKLYFAANDGVQGIELWSTDGTTAGTTLVKNISVYSTGNPASSSPANFTLFNGKIYFTANDGLTGIELWMSDGTTAGTTQVKDINPGTASASPASLTAVGNKLFFTANDGVNGIELWVTDGTAAGTTLVKDINPGAATSSSPAVLTPFGNKLFFRALEATTGSEPYITDGTSAGTLLLKDIGATTASSTPSNPTVVGNKLFFVASDTATVGTELFVTDGTAAGTSLVIDLFTGTSSGCVTTALTIVPFGNGVLFQGNNGSTVNGAELFFSDGTSAGTTLVKDINAGTVSSSPANMTAFGGKVLFSASTAAALIEPWITDGTGAGTVQLIDAYPGASSSSPANFVVAGNAAFFLATNSTATVGTGRELYVTDGTPGGTSLVLDISPGTPSGCAAAPVAIGVGKKVILNATDGVNGNELWVSDGTAAGTKMVSDLFPGSSSSSPTNFAVVGNVVVMSASNGTDKIALPSAVGIELFAVSLFALKAAEIEQIGTGCAGVAGIPTIGTTGGAPSSGNAAFAATLGNAAPSLPCALWLSNARNDIALGPCTFHPSLATFVTTFLGTSVTGTATANLPVPVTPAIVGAQVWMQWVVRDNAGAYGPGLTSFSPALRIRIGNS